MSDSSQIINGTPSLIISYWFYSIISPSYPSLHNSFFMVGILLIQIQPKSFKPWTGSSRFSEARPPFDGSGLRFRGRPTFAQQAREAGGMRVGCRTYWLFVVDMSCLSWTIGNLGCFFGTWFWAPGWRLGNKVAKAEGCVSQKSRVRTQRSGRSTQRYVFFSKSSISARARRLKIELPPTLLFDHPTINVPWRSNVRWEWLDSVRELIRLEGTQSWFATWSTLCLEMVEKNAHAVCWWVQ